MKKGIIKVGVALASTVLISLGFSSCNLFRRVLPQPLEYGTPNTDYIEHNDSIGENMTSPDATIDNGKKSKR